MQSQRRCFVRCTTQLQQRNSSAPEQGSSVAALLCLACINPLRGEVMGERGGRRNDRDSDAQTNAGVIISMILLTVYQVGMKNSKIMQVSC